MSWEFHLYSQPGGSDKGCPGFGTLLGMLGVHPSRGPARGLPLFPVTETPLCLSPRSPEGPEGMDAHPGKIASPQTSLGQPHNLPGPDSRALNSQSPSQSWASVVECQGGKLEEAGWAQGQPGHVAGVLGRARIGACAPSPPQGHTPKWAQATSSSLVPDGGGPLSPEAPCHPTRVGRAHHWFQRYLEGPRPGPHSKVLSGGQVRT